MTCKLFVSVSCLLSSVIVIQVVIAFKSCVRFFSFLIIVIFSCQLLLTCKVSANFALFDKLMAIGLQLMDKISLPLMMRFMIHLIIWDCKRTF